MSTDQEELRKNRVWKAMSGYQKHMTLMYFYRLLTDRANILDYVETHRFQKMSICPFDLPDFIFYLKPEQLRDMAREQPLSIVSEDEPKKVFKKPTPNFSTMDYSNFLPEEPA